MRNDGGHCLCLTLSSAPIQLRACLLSLCPACTPLALPICATQEYRRPTARLGVPPHPRYAPPSGSRGACSEPLTPLPGGGSYCAGTVWGHDSGIFMPYHRGLLFGTQVWNEM